MQPFKLQPTDGTRWFRANIKCQAACPVNTEAFAYVSALAEGDHEAAYTIARRPNPFPFICGRVCASLRAGLPPGRHRRTDLNPRPEKNSDRLA